MLDPITAVGLAGTVAQFVTTANELGRQIKDFIDTAEQAPKALHDLAVQLPCLAEICKGLEEDYVDTDSESLYAVIKSCHNHLKELKDLTGKVIPTGKHNKFDRAWKAVQHVFHYERKFQESQKVLETYKSTLTLYCSNERRGSNSSVRSAAPITILPPPPVTPSIIRYTLLREIDLRFGAYADTYLGPKVVVLLGMGGQGKTRLALEYCQQGSRDSRWDYTIWVDATSKQSLIRSYEDVADRLARGRRVFANTVSRVAFVKEKLAGRTWLLVFDNLDHPDDVGPLGEFMPAGNGSVIITSRDHGTRRLGKNIELSAMEEIEGRDLLLQGTRHRASDPHARKEALKINERLGYLPLAIDQASAYIQAQDLPLELYLKHYEQAKRNVLSQKHIDWNYVKQGDSDDKDKISLTVLTTWEMSFQQIDNRQNRREKAEHLLTLASFLGNTDIRERLIRTYFMHCSTVKSWCSAFSKGYKWDSMAFRDTVAELSRLSLVQRESTQGKECCISLHPMIRDWLQLRVPEANKCVYIAEATSIVATFIENTSREGLHNVHRDILEHQDACCMHDAAETSLDPRLGFKGLRGAAVAFANLYTHYGRHREAERPLQNVLENDRTEHGSEHPETLKTVRLLAEVYTETARYSQSQTLLETALASYGKLSRTGDVETSRLLASLAAVHMKQDHQTEAEALFEEAIRGLQSSKSSQEDEMLLCMANLAIVKRFLGKQPESGELFARALIGQEKRKLEGVGDATEMLRVVGGLADLRRSQGHYEESEQMYLRAWEGYKQEFGPDHPMTTQMLTNLAIAYRNQEKYYEAEACFREAWDGFQKVLGRDHPDTLRALMNLTIVIDKQGYYALAEIQYKEVLSGRKEKFGPGNPYTLRTTERLAWMLWLQHRRDEAESLAASILVAGGKMSANDCIARSALCRYPALEALYSEAKARYSKKLAADHIDVLETDECLSEVLRVHGKVQEANALRDFITKATLAQKLKKSAPRDAADLLNSQMKSREPPGTKGDFKGKADRLPTDELQVAVETQLNLSLISNNPWQTATRAAQRLGLETPAGRFLVLLLALSMCWQCLGVLQRVAPLQESAAREMLPD